ncbi:3214_t:CDS:2, partial [Racocetra persica]
QLSNDFQDLGNEMQQRNVQGTQGIQGEDLSAKVWDISIVESKRSIWGSQQNPGKSIF